METKHERCDKMTSDTSPVIFTSCLQNFLNHKNPAALFFDDLTCCSFSVFWLSSSEKRPYRSTEKRLIATRIFVSC